MAPSHAQSSVRAAAKRWQGYAQASHGAAKMVFVPNADTVFDVEGNTNGCDTASVRSVRRGLRPWHVRTLLVREPGDIGSGREAPPVRIGVCVTTGVDEFV